MKKFETNGRTVNVIDLDKETFTDIDLQKKTYAVLTFADMMRRYRPFTLNMEGTEKMAPSMPCYEEVRNFYTRMAQKMAWAPNAGFMGAMAAQQPGMEKGMAEVSKEMAKLDGMSYWFLGNLPRV